VLIFAIVCNRIFWLFLLLLIFIFLVLIFAIVCNRILRLFL
jgi:hypothetical protein